MLNASYLGFLEDYKTSKSPVKSAGFMYVNSPCCVHVCAGFMNLSEGHIRGCMACMDLISFIAI